MFKPWFLLLLVPAIVLAQAATLTGRWVSSADSFGTPLNFPMELNQQGDKLTGDFGGDKLEGTLVGNSIHFLPKDEQGGTEAQVAHAGFPLSNFNLPCRRDLSAPAARMIPVIHCRRALFSSPAPRTDRS
jgi:hypothetical protein